MISKLIVLHFFHSTEYRENVKPDNLFLVAGVSHGIDVIASTFTKPGDAIVVEVYMHTYIRILERLAHNEFGNIICLRMYIHSYIHTSNYCVEC